MKRIYVDMDGVLCDFSKARKQELERDPTQAYPQAQFGFWMDLEPIPGAIEAFKKLCESFDVWILSRPSFDNLNSFTEKAYWVKKYFGPDILRKLILCRNKSLLIGDYLIDDCVNAHQREFKGTFIHFGTEEFPNWGTVVRYFDFNKSNLNIFKLGDPVRLNSAHMDQRETKIVAVKNETCVLLDPRGGFYTWNCGDITLVQ